MRIPASRHGRALIVSGTAAGLLVGCTTTPAPDPTTTPGPFGPPFDHLASCSPPGVREVWFGARTLTNSGASDVTIDGVSLDNATAMTLTKSVLVPDVPVGGLFWIDPNPAQAFLKGEWNWARRTPAVGAVIKPGKTYELILKTRKDGPVGSFRGVTVTYHDATHTYRRTDDRFGFMGVRDCAKADEQALTSLASTPTS